jgi:hypothetical protein
MDDYFTADLHPTLEDLIDPNWCYECGDPNGVCCCGSGTFPDEDEPEYCPLCSGTGYLEELMGDDCPVCAGTGYLD